MAVGKSLEFVIEPFEAFFSLILVFFFLGIVIGNRQSKNYHFSIHEDELILTIRFVKYIPINGSRSNTFDLD